MMKKLLVLLIALVGTTLAQAQEIKWMSINEALAAQKKNPKKIVMDVYTNWCGPCKMMDKNTFSNADVAAYVNENFYPVKFNAEGNEEVKYMDKTFKNPNYDPKKANTRSAPHMFTYALGVKAYPSLVYFDEAGQYIEAIPGYLQPNQLELYLKLISSDDYKDITSKEDWEEYQENFEPTFKAE